jgi:hypothetical protein
MMLGLRFCLRAVVGACFGTFDFPGKYFLGFPKLSILSALFGIATAFIFLEMNTIFEPVISTIWSNCAFNRHFFDS